MRISSAFALPLLAVSSVVASHCTCWDDNGIEQSPASNGAPSWSPPSGNSGSSSSGGSSSGGNNWPAPAPIVKVPKVKPTEENLTKGAAAAVQGLTEKNIIPADTAAKINDAINEAIKQYTKPKQVVQVQDSDGTTTTMTVSPVATVVPTVVTTTLAGSTGVETIMVTQTVTALPPGATILSNQTIEALENIQEAIDSAIAAVNLSMTGLDAATQNELQTCLRQVLENGGLPEGYSCISQSGSTSAGLQSTFNNILEQFLGILPASLIDNIQAAVMPMLGGLLPDEKTLLGNINSAISSVVSSLSGNSVTALSMMESCYSMAIKQNSNTSYLQCYMSDNGPFETLQTATNGVIQQFIGVLPGEVIDSVRNLTSSTLKAGAYEDLSGLGTNITTQLNNALASITSTLSGNAVTLTQELQTCMNEVIVNANATAAQNCISQKPAASARTMVNGLAEQLSGYLPSSFFSDLVSAVDDLNSTTYSKDQIVGALDKAFNNANMGPAYVGCFEQVQTCILNEIAATGNIASTCPEAVKGCELIGSQNSTSLANTTADAQVAEIKAAAANTTTFDDSEAYASASTSSVEESSSVASESSSSSSSSASSDSSSASSTASAIESSSSADASSSAASTSAESFSSSESSSSSAPASSSESSVPPSSSSASATSTESAASSSSFSESSSSSAASETAAPSSSANATRHKRERSFGKLKMMYEKRSI